MSTGMSLNGGSMERTVNTSNVQVACFEPAVMWHAVLGDDAVAEEWVAVRPYLDRFVVSLVRIYLTSVLRPILAKNNYYARAGRGRKVALKDFMAAREQYSYVFKTDVRSYL